ncbi:MAG: hypothetical protein LBE82_05250 [Chitinophagaceae bacterium]|jgi:uncharacterized protein YkwD|nr:hypothetical protein [Chitinophagaceae bacterium]
MKKFFVFFILFSGLSFASMAQQRMDPAQRKERDLKELKDANLGLSDAQADSVVSINMEAMQQMRGMRDLSQDERMAKMKEVTDYRQKRWAQALQNDDLVKKVSDYYQQRMQRRMQGRGGNGSGGQ